MHPFNIMTGNHVTDDDDRIILPHDSRTSVDVSAPPTEVVSIEKYIPSSCISTDVSPHEEHVLPLTVHDLCAVDTLYNPPSLTVCRELLFEGKAKIYLADVKAITSCDREGVSQFWKSFAAEMHDFFKPECSPVLLPKLLMEMQSMLVYLYPDSKCVIEEISLLDIDFIVGQLQKGNFSFHELVRVIASIFKANCAPKRDPIIDQILALAKEECWINVFKLCVEMFEIMKMDLMNYRLVLSRESILKDYILRERAYFEELFYKDPKLIISTKRWLEESFREKCKVSSKECLETAFVSSILLSKYSYSVPETFSLDSKRIHALRSAIQEVVILACVFIGFEHITGTRPSDHVADELRSRVVIFLGKVDCKMVDLINQILLVAMRENGNVAKSDKRAKATILLNNILHQNSHVYCKVRERLEMLLTSALFGKPLPFNLTTSRLSHFLTELNLIISNAKLLWDIHLKIHGPRYRSILAELIEDKS